MGRVHIVTDSNAYLPPELLARYPIKVIPHRIKVGRSFYEEDDSFSADEMFRKLREAQAGGQHQLPQVAVPDINAILDCYQGFGRNSEQIVSIHMSGELSNMWQMARRGAEMLRGRYTIRVIDSLSTSFGLGLLVEQAARAADAGASIHEIARLVNGAVPHLYLATFAESLSYLERSARLSPSQSLLGTMLGIKAMLMMEDGKLVPLEKVQTRDEVTEKLQEFVSEFARVERIGILHHGYDQTKQDLIARLHEALPGVDVASLTYPPSLAAYLGPNMIGVVVYEGTF